MKSLVKAAWTRIARWPGWVEGGIATLVSLVVAWRLLHLAGADLRVPFSYEGDGLEFSMLAKSIFDHGWYLTNPHLAAPGVLEVHSYPYPDLIHFLVWKTLSWFTADWALAFNVYFLLGFPLITLASLAVMRHFRVRFGSALAVSLLYAFLPSRLFKGEGHYFLDIFYEVPLAILVALWVCQDDPPLTSRSVGEVASPANDTRARRVRSWTAVAICLLTAGTGVYYAFFTGILIATGGIWTSIRRRSARNALSGVGLTAIIALGLGAQGIPTWLHDRHEGKNLEVAARSHHESEELGMRLAQLLLPVPGHRVTALRELRKRYDSSAPFRGESSSTALGSVASVGCIALLVLMLIGARADRSREELWRPLAVFNLVAILVGTMGGIGSMVGLLVTPQIRTYSRMSVIIAFLSLFAVALLIDRWGNRLGRFAVVLPLAVLAAGLFDQVTPAATRPYAEIKARYRNDAAFVHHIEAALPPDAMVFELPYGVFPEGPRLPGGQIGEYDLLQLYLHSRTIHWSFPSMRGTTQDAWNWEMSLRPAAQLTGTLADAGFGGILINRKGYADGGAQIESAIARELGTTSLVSADDRLAFFSLLERAREVRADLPELEAERRRDLALHPPLLRFPSGCYPLEYTRSEQFRWCTAAGTIEIDNDARRVQPAVLTAKLFAGRPPTRVTIEGDLLADTIEIPAGGQPIARTLVVPPGHHELRFRAVGQPADAPNDPRWLNLIWRIENPRLQ